MQPASSKKVGPEVMNAIIAAAEKIDFGQIVIKIQDRRIVQIDSLERKRIGDFKTDKADRIEYNI
jgi:hypothetical protein